MLDAFRRGEDIHRRTAVAMFGEELADDMRQQTEFKNQQIRDGGLRIAADSRHTFVV